MLIVFVPSVWDEEVTELKLECSLKNSMCWFVHLFDIFVGFFLSCCDFYCGSACHGRGRGEKPSGGTRNFFVVVLFGFIFSFNSWFVSLICVFWAQCIVPLSTALWIVLSLWQSCLITLLLRILSMFVPGRAGFLVSVKAWVVSRGFLCILSPALHSIRGGLWGLSGQIRLKEWRLLLLFKFSWENAVHLIKSFWVLHTRT